mgnify:CR=1 FL=1
MPELPEVETVRRGLTPVMEGRKIKSCEAYRPDLRWPLPKDFAKRLTGRRIQHIDRRAKYLLFYLDKGLVLVNHLGMSGRFLILPQPGTRAARSTAQAGQAGSHPALGKHDHVAITLDTGTVVRFNDPRRFGMFDLVPEKTVKDYPLLAELGPEPLSNSFSGPVLAANLKGRRTAIKQAILDQKVVAGVGNIYASEALYRAGISPERLAAAEGLLLTSSLAGIRPVVALDGRPREAAQPQAPSPLRGEPQCDGAAPCTDAYGAVLFKIVEK